jgi:hypothetical protein
MQQDIRHAVVGNDESVALGDIEPLDRTGELDDVRRFIGNVTRVLQVEPIRAGRLCVDAVRRHDAARCHSDLGVSSGRCESLLHHSKIAPGSGLERPKFDCT